MSFATVQSFSYVQIAFQINTKHRTYFKICINVSLYSPNIDKICLTSSTFEKMKNQKNQLSSAYILCRYHIYLIDLVFGDYNCIRVEIVNCSQIYDMYSIY